MKLLFPEPQSEALASWIAARPDLPKLTSQLSVIEVVLTCHRRDPAAEPGVRSLLAGLDLIPISQEVVERAIQVRQPQLRSLDAIQLATALTVKDGLEAFVAYDRCLLEAAGAEQLPVVAPD